MAVRRRIERFCAAAAVVLSLLGAHASTAVAQDCATVVDKHRHTSVSIRVEGEDAKTGAIKSATGTGVIVSTDGYVLTNNHVVDLGSGVVNVNITGSIGSAVAASNPMTVIAREPTPDLAVLKFANTAIQYRAAPIGDIERVRRGAPLCTFGYPREIEFRNTVGTLGAPSGPRGWWLTDITTNDGESGSPVFSEAGNLIGLRVAGRTDAVGIYYIVPINLAANLLRLVPNKFAAGPETTRPPKQTQFSLFVPQSALDKAPAAYAARLGFKTAKTFRVLIDKVRFTEVSYATMMLEGGVLVSPLTPGIHEISVMAVGEYGSSQVLNCSFSVGGLPRALHLEGEQSGDFSRVPQCEIRDGR